MAKVKLSITTKTKLVICLVAGVVLLLVGGANYIWTYTLLKNTLGAKHHEHAQMLATSVSELFDDEIKEITVLMSGPVVTQVLKEGNLKSGAMSPEGRQLYFQEMDKIWCDPAEGPAPIITELLNTAASQRLKSITQQKENIGEIFITDIYGGLLAASDQTSDFYQADEKWWQATYCQGNGEVFIGDVAWDVSAGIYSITLSLPLRNDSGQIIGICKAIENIGEFFKPVANFVMAKTGHAALTDGEGLILFHSGVLPMSRLYFENDADFQRLLVAKGKWLESSKVATYERGPLFIAWEEVKHVVLANSRMKMLVFVAQDVKEAFAPLNRLAIQSTLLAGVLIIVLLIVGQIFGKRLVAPILTLHKFVEQVAKGELSGVIKIQSSDEIERLATAFNEMSTNIAKKQLELVQAKVAVEQQSKILEEKVSERTQELAQTQAATLNIMEDLQESYKQQQEMQSQLIQAEKMEAVGRMASGIAHEVKNPLGIVLQGVNFLEQEMSPAKGELTEVFKIMKDNVARADKIVRSLVDYARKSEFNLKAENINEIIKTSLGLVAHRVKLESVKVEMELEENLPSPLIDKGKIEQVLVNLFVNAIQAMPKGGVLRVRSFKTQLSSSGFRVGRRKRDGDYFSPGEEALQVEVEDSGVGISKENLDRVFEPFFTTKDIGEGTGLGLTVVRDIMEMHRGIVAVDSEVDQGTTIALIFKIKMA